jgi:hypothetical protein
MWDNEKASHPAQPDDADANDDFGDDFDDFAEEGGDDDFGDFDEAEEATPAPPFTETNPSSTAKAPSVVDNLVSSTYAAGNREEHSFDFSI